MIKLSLLEKLKILLNITKSSKLFIALIIFLIFFAYILLTTNKKNKKTSKSIFILIYTFILLFIVITYHSSLGKMFDYLMNNLFIIFYFPNLAAYLAAIILTNIIIWISVFNFKTTRFIKNINITIFCLLNYLLALILNVITAEKLDVFTTQSVYGSKNALALIQLSSLIFITWLIFLIIYKIYIFFIKKEYKQPIKKVVVQKRIRKLPDSITETTIPKVIRLTTNSNNYLNANVTNYNKINEIEKTLTIDDYKLILNILKDQKGTKQDEQILEDKLSLALKKENFYVEPEIIKTKETTLENKESYQKEQTIFEELKQLYNIN